ncbi:RDD family protein [Nocardia sp. NPDC050697]|uniref:RDD family protein n=1 Tax=Nocardia sp. NPDC050697 TaxID=3155158 RepID=UPI0033D9F3F9
MAAFTTGEAVALELPIARIPTRATAFLVDVVLQVVLALLAAGGLLVLGTRFDLDSAWFDALVVVLIVGVLIGYPVLWETLTTGRTPGKFVLGLRVVRADGGPVDLRHTLTRGLAGAIVDFWLLGVFGAVAVLTSLCSPNARRVGDVLAGTVVVHAQRRLPLPALAVPPPWLAEWVARTDPTALPDDLALAVRRYLTRLPDLTPAAAHDLGVALVRAVCAALGVPAPGTLPPVQILGAIVAERQRRALPGLRGPVLVPGAGNGLGPALPQLVPVGGAAPGPSPWSPRAALPGSAPGLPPSGTPGGGNGFVPPPVG